MSPLEISWDANQLSYKALGGLSSTRQSSCMDDIIYRFVSIFATWLGKETPPSSLSSKPKKEITCSILTVNSCLEITTSLASDWIPMGHPNLIMFMVHLVEWKMGVLHCLVWWKRGWVKFSTQAQPKPSSQTREGKMERKCFVQRIYYFIPYNYNLFYHFFM